MALAIRITKAAYDKLSDDVKEHYEADGDKHFKLDVSGLEDTGALQRAKARAEEEVADLKAENKELTGKVKSLEEAAGPGAKDVDRLTRNFERRMATMKEEHEATLKGRDAFIEEQLIGTAATGLATEISTVPSLMAEHIRKRMNVDFSGEKPKIVFKDKKGETDPALKLEDIKKEMLANPEFKPILAGNKATGGTAQRGALPAGGATPAKAGDGGAAPDVNAMGSADFVAHIRQMREQAGNNSASEGAQQ